MELLKTVKGISPRLIQSSSTSYFSLCLVKKIFTYFHCALDKNVHKRNIRAPAMGLGPFFSLRLYEILLLCRSLDLDGATFGCLSSLGPVEQNVCELIETLGVETSSCLERCAD